MVAILSAILNSFTNPQQRNNLQTKTRQKEWGGGGGGGVGGEGWGYKPRFEVSVGVQFECTVDVKLFKHISLGYHIPRVNIS